MDKTDELIKELTEKQEEYEKVLREMSDLNDELIEKKVELKSTKELADSQASMLETVMDTSVSELKAMLENFDRSAEDMSGKVQER